MNYLQELERMQGLVDSPEAVSFATDVAAAGKEASELITCLKDQRLVEFGREVEKIAEWQRQAQQRAAKMATLSSFKRERLRKRTIVRGFARWVET